jgi:hypothetical protein
MKKKFVFICIVFITIPLSFRELYALGLGGYLTGKGGVSTLKVEKTNSSVDYGVGAGFVLDTAVASNDYCNYRLNVGYENTIKSGTPFFGGWSMHRISISNTFGYAFFRNKFMRVWMGPQIELACQFNVASERTNGINPHGFYYNMPFFENRVVSIDFALFSLGLGAVLGVNFNAGDFCTVSLETGINTCIGIGPYHERKNAYTYSVGFFLPSGISSKSKDIVFGKAEGLMRLSFLYRVGDTFVPETPQNVDVKIRQN